MRSEEAGVAQWLERQPSKLRVAGSNPVSRSIIMIGGHVLEGLSPCECTK